MKELEVRLFGAFRKYVPSGRIQIKVDGALSAAQVKRAIYEAIRQQSPDFAGKDLISESALANENEVLLEDAIVGERGDLALLPPVCGG